MRIIAAILLAAACAYAGEQTTGWRFESNGGICVISAPNDWVIYRQNGKEREPGHSEPGELIFADRDGNTVAQARRTVTLERLADSAAAAGEDGIVVMKIDTYWTVMQHKCLPPEVRTSVYPIATAQGEVLRYYVSSSISPGTPCPIELFLNPPKFPAAGLAAAVRALQQACPRVKRMSRSIY